MGNSINERILDVSIGFIDDINTVKKTLIDSKQEVPFEYLTTLMQLEADVIKTLIGQMAVCEEALPERAPAVGFSIQGEEWPEE